MKLKRLVCALVSVAVLVSFAACGLKDKKNYVSQLRTDILTGNAEGLEFTAYAEEREIPLISDGYAGVRTPVIIIKISSLSAFYGTYEISVSIDGKKYSAAPELKADTVMRAVIPIEKAFLKKEITVELKGEKETSIALTSILPDGVCEYGKAVETAFKAIGDKAVYEGRKLKGEISARVLSENGNVYWYVGYANGETVYSVLVSADGEQVVAQKEFRNEI